jgi:hypothetical protein
MRSRQTDAERAGGCYVFFRVFPGLREPCDLARYVTLPDAEINTAMEADAARWLHENRAQVMEKLRKQSQQRMGIGAYRNKPRSAPAARPFTFPVIARIAGWTYRECFSIGVGHNCWASARFPILVAANERDAADICDGLNHRHCKHPHPDSPRFGWLPAIAFPHDEQLDIGAKIVEAQTGMIHGEAAAVIHSLAAEAVAFHESRQRSQALAAEPSETEDGDDEESPVPLPLTPGTGAEEGKARETPQRAEQKRRGRKPKSHPHDEQIVRAWKTGKYPTKKDLAAELNKSLKLVKSAIERDRDKRRRPAGKSKRVKSKN